MEPEQFLQIIEDSKLLLIKLSTLEGNLNITLLTYVQQLAYLVITEYQNI